MTPRFDEERQVWVMSDGSCYYDDHSNGLANQRADVTSLRARILTAYVRQTAGGKP